MIKQIALAAAATLAAFAAQAIECRSADAHNSDDHPTVAAAKHMSEVLQQKSGGKYTKPGLVLSTKLHWHLFAEQATAMTSMTPTS